MMLLTTQSCTPVEGGGREGEEGGVEGSGERLKT